eukprot:m.47735 g.47735  ORF g.47735 m.47735 type:complete len:528 (+) comp20562_c0_seq3:209-1792(+)
MAQNFSPNSDTRITVPGVGTNVNGKEVYYGGNKATVMMGRQYLSIERERTVLVNIALRDIISVLVGDANSGGGRSSVTVCYIRMSGASTCIPQMCGSECSMPEAVQLHFDCLEAEALVSDVRMAARLPHNKPTRRSFAAILNPVSGNSKSLQVLHDVVIPILSLSGVELTTFFTKAKGDAEKFSRTLKLDTNGNEFEGVISMGGDGTATEVHSGNMRNLRLPFAVIPVGSDNCLASTLGVKTVVEALLGIIKGPLISVDVLSLHELPSGSTTIEGPAVVYPMCCIALGVMADALVDIERTRWMGRIRTTLVSLKRVFYDGFLMAGPRKYKWNVKYRPRPVAAFSKCFIPDQKPCKVCEVSSLTGPDVSFETVPWQTIKYEDLAHVTIGTHAAKVAQAPKLSLFPPAHHGDGSAELFAIKGNRLLGMAPHLLGTLSGVVYYDNPDVSYCKVAEVLIHCDSDPAKGPGSDHFVMGVDGEVFRPRTPAVGIKIHPRAAQMYIYREYWGTSSKHCLESFFSSTPKRDIRDL